MKRRAVLAIAGALAPLLSVSHVQPAHAVQACADRSSCAEVAVALSSTTAKRNDVVTATLSFKQGPASDAAGGVDKIAALALTLGIPGTSAGGTPLALADCTLNGNGLPNSVRPDAALSNFSVVVENASCTNGRTHCLCPDVGGPAPDNFINLVVYGPNPLPTPGPNPIDIPTLPTGNLVQIDLTVGPTASGTIPLHLFNEQTDTTHPQFTALLSVGDKVAVDQTCVPIAGTPPCGSDASVSQVFLTDGSIAVQSCVGDCDGSGAVTVSEIIKMVNIALGTAQFSTCPAGDGDGNGLIQVPDIIKAVNNVLNGCS